VQIGIIGGGESGVGAALLALKNGDVPFVSDYGKIADHFRQELINNKVRFEESGHSFDILSESDIVVKSPGVSGDVKILQRLRKEANIPIISELEYGFRSCQGKIIAITGSNGKTTTTNLIHHLLITGGMDAVKGGNLGTCLSKLIVECDTADYYVVEVSSFQLDDITSFKPEIAMILNITPDHLDRYQGKFENYTNAKLNIAKYQDDDDVLFLLDDLSDRVGSDVKSQQIVIEQDQLIAKHYSYENSSLRGDHNCINASFAIEVASRCDINNEMILRGLNSFVNDDHRLQLVGKLRGAEWINDSKATNVDSTYYALKAMNTDIVWIAGGVDKGNDYSQVITLVTDKVKCLICLGRKNDPLLEAFGEEGIKILEASSMPEAVDLAYNEIKAGETVLLSPACASFDLFDNYKDRGNQFMMEVKKRMKTKE